ncbi:hypothetical protein CI102_6828 [Trichoderma harzianum]|nr:hypothetical protein CI102_6828 [Trichoderma harzianum]
MFASLHDFGAAIQPHAAFYLVAIGISGCYCMQLTLDIDSQVLLYFLSLDLSLPSSPSYTCSFRSDSTSFDRKACTRTNTCLNQETLPNQVQAPCLSIHGRGN